MTLRNFEVGDLKELPRLAKIWQRDTHRFISLVSWRYKDIRQGGNLLMRRVNQVLGHVNDRQNWYEADVEIYGDFEKQVAKCRALINDDQNSITVDRNPINGSGCG